MAHDDASGVSAPGMSERPGEDHALVGHQRPLRSPSQKDIVPQRRRRSGVALSLGAIFVGSVLVAHTFWGGVVGAGRRQDETSDGVVQDLHQIFRGDPALAAESKATGVHSTAHGPAWGFKTAAPKQQLIGEPRKPKITEIKADEKLLRAVGGQMITVIGENFGDEDAAVSVRVGSTLAMSTTWVSPREVFVKTPPGVGAHLDVTVEVEEPAQPVVKGVAKSAFSYGAPYIFDMKPFIVGQPVMGPMDITIHAYGLGTWDTKPVALIDGHQCSVTTWVDNMTVVCTIGEGTRLNLENPEVKVAGQRSHCAIIVPGVCTMGSHGASVNSVQRLKKEIAELRARGGDVNELKKKIMRMKARAGVWEGKNDKDHPCDDMADCYPRTILTSFRSALLMMMGMGSICLVLFTLRPLSMWVQKEFFTEEEDLDETDPANAVALRAREFDPRITLTGL